MTYYASSLFTRSREKHGWTPVSLLPSLAFAERTKSLKFFLKVLSEGQKDREATTGNTSALRRLC